MSDPYDSSDSEDDRPISANGFLAPPPSTPSANDQLRPRASSFSSPALIPRSRSESIVSNFDGDDVGVGVSAARPLSASRNNRPSSRSSRPGSNQRSNRTPMRSVTPVLGPVNRSTIANEDDGDQGARSSSRNNSNGRPSSSSASASARQSPIVSRNTHRVVGLGAGLAVGTVFRSERGGLLSALHETREHGAVARQGRSNKQGPGHRKVRRWNNDKFIGTFLWNIMGHEIHRRKDGLL